MIFQTPVTGRFENLLSGGGRIGPLRLLLPRRLPFEPALGNDNPDFERLAAVAMPPPPRPALRRQNAFGPQVIGPRRPLPIYSSVAEARPADWECPVCLEGPEKEVVMFPCGRHDFHRHCLVRLWQEDYRCPICRQVNNNKSL